MGLSCASCHLSARANKEFFIQQISDRPGTADISHHFLSSAGGDDSFNPRKIPDLADVEGLRIPNRQSAEFDELLTQLIEVEFDGQKPSAAVFSALKAYLAQQDVAHCKSQARVVPRNLNHDWALIDDGLSSLELSITLADHDTSEFILASMRSVLETIYRFYPTVKNQTLDAEIISVSRNLQNFSLAKHADGSDELAALIDQLNGLKQRLSEFEDRSLYEPSVAQQFLQDL